MLRSVLLLAMSLFKDTFLFSCFIGLTSIHIWLTSCLRSQDSVWTRVQPVRNIWHLVRFIFDLCHKRWEQNIQPQPPCPSSCQGRDVLSTPLGEWSEFSSLKVNLVRMHSLWVPQCCFSFLDRWQQTRPSQPRWACCQPLIEIWRVRCFGIRLIFF